MTRGQWSRAVLLLFFAAGVLVPSTWQPGLLPCYRDLLDFVYPMKVHLARSLQAGQVPWWDPYSLGGHPFFANLQSQVFYLPNILFVVLPGPWALSLFLALHHAWAGLGAWRLARELRCSEPAALFAGVGVLAGGFSASLGDCSRRSWVCSYVIRNFTTFTTY